MILDPHYYPFVFAGGAVLLILVIAFGFFGSANDMGDKTLEKRLKREEANAVTAALTKHSKTGHASVRRGIKYSSIPAVDSFLRRILPNADRLRILLERTGRAVSISEYLMISVGTILGVGLLLKFVTPLAVYLCFMIGLLVGVVLPLKIVRIIGNRRVAAFMKEFTNAIDLIVRGLRSGLPFIESVNAVGREFPDPLGLEFRRMSDSVKLGQSIESAMWEVAERIDAPEYKFMIVAMTIQRETGGNLAETLGNLSDLLRKRRALYLKIRALSSEARASAYIIGALPFIMFCLLNVVNHDYISLLWTDHRGQMMALKGIGWMSIGHYVMYRMVNFEF